MFVKPATVFAAFLIPPVRIVRPVRAIEIAKISLYIVFLSFRLSAHAEKPRRPPAVKIADTVEMIPA